MLRLIILLFFASQVVAIELEEKIPIDAVATNSRTMISSSQLSEAYTVVERGINYKFTVGVNGLINYISVKDFNFKTEEGLSINSTYIDLTKITNGDLIKQNGWGYYIKLRSGWAAAFCKGETCTSNPLADEDRIGWFFKRK